MSATTWADRRQWTASVKRDGVHIDITITRAGKERWWTWWLDGVNASPWYCTSPAVSLTEAKRRSLQDAEAYITRAIAARGGA